MRKCEATIKSLRNALKNWAGEEEDDKQGSEKAGDCVDILVIKNRMNSESSEILKEDDIRKACPGLTLKVNPILKLL